AHHRLIQECRTPVYVAIRRRAPYFPCQRYHCQCFVPAALQSCRLEGLDCIYVCIPLLNNVEPPAVRQPQQSQDIVLAPRNIIRRYALPKEELPHVRAPLRHTVGIELGLADGISREFGSMLSVLPRQRIDDCEPRRSSLFAKISRSHSSLK